MTEVKSEHRVRLSLNFSQQKRGRFVLVAAGSSFVALTIYWPPAQGFFNFLPCAGHQCLFALDLHTASQVPEWIPLSVFFLVEKLLVNVTCIGDTVRLVLFGEQGKCVVQAGRRWVWEARGHQYCACSDFRPL